MDIYRSPGEQQQALSDHPVFYSRSRLLTGVVIWSLAACIFAALTWSVRHKTMGMLFCGALVVIAVLLAVNCIRQLGRLQRPVLVFTQQGLRLDDGRLVPWEAITENRFIVQQYVGITTGRLIRIHTNRSDMPLLMLRAGAMAIGADEYLALCDRYGSAG
ncbi:hypothetical protein [Stenotrophomonas sp. MMGLT7]|uniref:hypothetical protein n=1 Tax=Stenotrophomonas sp. MMGLT7 TaxID=2901227 RepID=UPI001E28FAA1|nr:hypothetical protein [Stenotrophomonas sp. MMGLT7]MCD7098260.1 hypothetical protein [Stenotrophomonas sp. MMGLT7]